MKRTAVVLALLCVLGTGLVRAEGTPVGFETITVSSTAVGLTSTEYDLTNSNIALRTSLVQCYVETAAVRYRVDGTDPTTSVGEILYAGDRIYLDSPRQIQYVRFIRATSTDATLHCTYWRP